MLHRIVSIILLVWPAVAQVYIDPAMIFNPDTPVEVVLDQDNYTQILVRERTNVKLDCSFVRSTFIADNGITNDESVTTRWWFAGEEVNGELYQPIILQRRKISGKNQLLSITRIRLPTLAVDGTTGEYTCEVCHNRGIQNNGEICVNSTVPIRGRSYPPDILDGARDGVCTALPFPFSLITCDVGTNYCIPNNDHRILQLLCQHDSTAPRTPHPQIGVWFINGVQVSSSVGGFRLPDVSNSISFSSAGKRMTIRQGAPRGNYTCQLTNRAGMDTATSIITDCSATPRIDLQVTLPQSTLNVTRIGAGQRSGPVAIQAGLDVVLYCPSSATNKRWFKRGGSTILQPVLPSTNHISLTTTDIQGVSTVILSIQRLGVEDYGEYVCVATNQAGRDEASVTLTRPHVYIDPAVIFTPDTPVEVVLDLDNYTQILVREETNVKLDCSFVRSTFIADNGITNDESVTTRWLFAREEVNGDILYQPFILQSSFLETTSISGKYNETLSITRIRLPTLAVDGTTGEYTCEVCHNPGIQSNGEICVNSTVPIRGRNYPPDILNGDHDGVCTAIPFPFSLVTCDVGTNYCIPNNRRTWTTQLLCQHDSTAPKTPIPQIGVWFINGVQVTSSVDGNIFPGVSNSIASGSTGQRMTIRQGAPRGNYTCQLTNRAGMDTATSIITDCRTGSHPRIDLQVTLPQSTLNVTRIGAGQRPGPVAIQAGLDVMLYCPSSAANTTRWFKRGTSLPALSSTTTTDIQGVPTVILSIQRLGVEDYGEYVCVATNQAGRDEASVTLTELGVWSTEEWSSCTRSRIVRCVGANGQQVKECSGDRPASVSTCVNCQ